MTRTRGARDRVTRFVLVARVQPRGRTTLCSKLGIAKIQGDAVAWSTRSRGWPYFQYDADAWVTRSRGRACATSTGPAQFQHNSLPYTLFTPISGHAAAWVTRSRGRPLFPYDAVASAMWSRGVICAIGTPPALLLRNSLFILILSPISLRRGRVADAIASRARFFFLKRCRMQC